MKQLECKLKTKAIARIKTASRQAAHTISNPRSASFLTTPLSQTARTAPASPYAPARTSVEGPHGPPRPAARPFAGGGVASLGAGPPLETRLGRPALAVSGSAGKPAGFRVSGFRFPGRPVTGFPGRPALAPGRVRARLGLGRNPRARLGPGRNPLRPL